MNASWSAAFRASFDGLPKPTSHLDWLATNKETGQTYDEFIEQCPYLDDSDTFRTCIYLTLLDHPEHRSSLDMDRLIDYTERFFQTTVRLIPLLTNVRWDPAKQSWLCEFLFQSLRRLYSSFTGTTKSRRGSTKEVKLRTRHDRPSGHTQIGVKSVLDQLKGLVPTDARCLVAVTLHDFYCDASDLFIAGLSNGNARVAAFSFFRYDPRLEFGDEFWHDWKLKVRPTNSMAQMILMRSCRLLTHEIGHLLGIDHCIYYACLMNGSGHLQEDFSQPLFLCPIDLKKLGRLAEFDVVRRYEQLLEFCTENSFEDETKILERRLSILRKGAKNKRKVPDDEATSKRKRTLQSVELEF